MNILLTNDAHRVAGGEKFVLFLARGLRDQGHQVIIAPMADSELAELSGIELFETIAVPYATRFREFGCAGFIVDRLRERSIDIVHTNSNIDRTVGALVARKLGCRCVTSVHSCMSIQHNLTHWIRNRFLIHHFLPVSLASQQVLVNEDGISAGKTTVVHNGIPRDSVAFSAELRARIRAEFGFENQHIVIGTLSRLTEFKGHTFLLQAVPDILQDQPRSRFLIVGDGELRESLAAEARERGVAHAVTFAGHRTDVSAILSACDIFAQPSRDLGGESFPLSVIEALAVRLPVVASDVGDIGDMIRDGVNGFLVKPEDTDALAAKIIRLAADRELRRELGDHGQEFFLRHLTLETLLEKIERVYSQVLRHAARST
jgi:glycosyltransferase involved in cell wall biosynthesis